ncbi:MAG: hypothetical protein J0G96_13830 [Flavobacteriia bacterium]|nr:hypothetical protein [Flavobacteriia bacterium]
MKAFFSRRWVRVTITTITILFALIGFFLCASYFAIMLGFTNQKGEVDINNRHLAQINEKYKGKEREFELSKGKEMDFLRRITLLNNYYPVNADTILAQYHKKADVTELYKMLDVIELTLDRNDPYIRAVRHYNKSKSIDYGNKKISKKNAFDWVNYIEWEDFKQAVIKDKHLIDSVSKVTGVESRLIVACLVGEQIRLFNSNRETYKKVIGPLKILSVESMYSYGVTGIKENTAKKIEYYLKDASSPYYLGEEYERLITYPGEDDSTYSGSDYSAVRDKLDTLSGKDAIRMNRLVDYRNHYYSYLYAALFVKQIKMQWQRAGFPIDDRPEILTTLFNVGYPQSVPKKDPKVGGSGIDVHGKRYTFGMITYEFYYSGELSNVFPIHGKKFDNKFVY